MSSRAFVGWVSVGLLSFACATPPQEDSTALADPEPPPEPEIIETPWPEPIPVIAEAPNAREPSAAATTTPTTNIPVCDEYLALYQRCETHLKPQIMAGDRRFYRAEAASLQHLAGTPEAAALPDSCRSMLDALQVDCPPQHRQPSPEPTP